jgi:hypothetical protein
MNPSDSAVPKALVAANIWEGVRMGTLHRGGGIIAQIPSRIDEFVHERQWLPAMEPIDVEMRNIVVIDADGEQVVAPGVEQARAGRECQFAQPPA